MHTSPRLTEFRQGWPTLLTVTVGSTVGVTALLFYSLGAFAGPLEREFSWSRSEISSAFLFTTIALTLMAVPLGWLLDRFGPRRIALVSAPGLAVALLLLTRVEGDLTAFRLLFGLAGILGAGTTSVIYTKALNAQFFQARGMALGISLGGLGLAAVFLPALVTAVITPFGWRAGFLLLAALSLAVLPFLLTGMSDRGAATTATGAAPRGLTRRQGVRSGTFWILVAGFVLVGGSVPAIIPHLVPLLTDAGMNPQSAAGVAGTVGIGVIIGRVCIGALVDRVHAPLVAAPLFLLTAAGFLLLLWGGTSFSVLAAFLMGLSFGAEADLIAFLCGHHFGMRSYGFLYGLVYGAFNLAVASGPIWAGAVFDATGSYNLALGIVAGMLVLGAGVILLLPRHQPFAYAEDPVEDHPSQSAEPAPSPV